MEALRLALWQTPHPGASGEALARLDAAAREAAAQGAHWLVTRGERQPNAKDWPSVKLAYGEWLRLPLR